MAWGRRCDLGCESWPDSNDYGTCPLCGQDTERFSNLKPLDAEEARAIVSGIKFDEFYDEWCRKRNVTTEGPFKRPDTGEELDLTDDGKLVARA